MSLLGFSLLVLVAGSTLHLFSLLREANYDLEVLEERLLNSNPLNAFLAGTSAICIFIALVVGFVELLVWMSSVKLW